MAQNQLKGVMPVGIPFSPDQVSNLTLWLKSTAGVTKDGSDLVATWANQASTGSAYDATQGTATNKPLWVANQLNGRPAIRFDGVDNFMSFGGTGLDLFRNLAGSTVFLVWKRAANGVRQYAYAFRADHMWDVRSGIHSHESSAPTNHIQFEGKATDAGTNDTLDESSAAGTGAIISVIQNNWSGQSATLYRDGVSTATDPAFSNAGPTSNTASPEGTLGCYPGGDGIKYHFLNGDLYEILVYQRALTDAEIAQIVSYLGAP